MTVKFNDHFSHDSDNYRQFRPSYPDELFYHLSHETKKHDLAWDCATGTGQAAVELSKYYRQVIATDASEKQIKQAQARKNIEYKVAPAENSGIRANSVDLITVAQALHWFDMEAFAREADRVMVDAGVLAAWTYNLLRINPEIDAIIDHLYHAIVGPFWPAERKLVENAYRDIQLPFSEIAVPDFVMHTRWTLSHLSGYLHTWSAVKRYEAEHHSNPVELIQAQLADAWGEPRQEHRVTWPLVLRMWRKI